MKGKRENVIVGWSLIRKGIGEISEIKIRIKKREEDGMRSYMNLKIGILMMRGNKMN